MIFALLSTILWSFANVFWKKCTAFRVRPFANSISSLPIPVLILIYFLIHWYTFNTADFISIIVVWGIVLLDLIKDPINQQIYKEEKISLLIPYQNLHKIFIIISSFFIFSDVSIITLCITLFTISVIIIASFDFKNKKLPRNFWKILFVEIVLSSAILLWAWIVLEYGEINYFVIYAILWAIIYLIIAFKTNHIYDLKTVAKTYWMYRLIAWFGWISWFISLLLIKNLWLSISILLGFIWIWVTLLISYIFLWDKPSKKNIILTLVVSLLIWVWYYFK